MTPPWHGAVTRRLGGGRSARSLSVLFLLLFTLGGGPAVAKLAQLKVSGKGEFISPGIEFCAITSAHGQDWDGALALRLSLTEVKFQLIPVDWGGEYVRVQRDFGAGRWRGALGVGIGYMIFGGEVGGVVANDTLGSTGGIEFTGLLTISLIGVYFRHTELLERDPITELGLRLNIPLER